MKTVGQILKSKRESLGVKLDDVAKVTKIRRAYLEALEIDDYKKLPGATYAKGFIKNYASMLEMDANTLVAIFRRDFAEDEKGQIIPRGKIEPLDETKFGWTPKMTMALLIGLIVITMGSYFGYQYYRLWHPRLIIEEPMNNEISATNMVKVAGEADPSSVVRINDELVILGEEGKFETTLTFEPGERIITIVSESKRGGKTIVERKVMVRE